MLGSVTISPASFNSALNYPGESQYEADPLFNGRLDELFIYGTWVRAAIAPAVSRVVWVTRWAPTRSSGASWPRWSPLVGRGRRMRWRAPVCIPHQCLHPAGCDLEPALLGGLDRGGSALFAHLLDHQSRQRASHVPACSVPWPQSSAAAQLGDSGGVVRLIPRDRQEELRAAGVKGCSGRSDPAVVDDCAAERKKLPEGGKPAVADCGGKARGDQFSVLRQQDTPGSQHLAGGDRCAEELPRVPHPRAEGERNGWGAVSAECEKIRRKFTLHTVEPAEAGQTKLWWPVRLWGRVPARVESDDQLRRQPPPEDAANRGQVQTGAESVQRWGHEEVACGIDGQPVKRAQRMGEPTAGHRPKGRPGTKLLDANHIPDRIFGDNTPCW